MNEPNYKKTAEGWQFLLEGNLLFEAKEISLIYTKNPDGYCSTFKHGPKKTMEEMLPKILASETLLPKDFQTDYHLIETTKSDPTRLNNVINTSNIPETEFKNLSIPWEQTQENTRSPIPLTKDCSPEIQHLIQGGKILIDNPLKNMFETLDLALILKRRNKEPTDPKTFTHEIIQWPDGTEVPADDFNPEEWSHMGDDYHKINDLDEDMREFFQKTIQEALEPHKAHIKILTQPTAPLPKPLKKISGALDGLPIETTENKSTKTELFFLGEQEATTENEKAYQNAKRNLAKDAVAQNLPPNQKWHHLSAYQHHARKKILSSPEPAETINLRLQLLEKYIQNAQKPDLTLSGSKSKETSTKKEKSREVELEN